LEKNGASEMVGRFWRKMGFQEMVRRFWGKMEPHSWSRDLEKMGPHSWCGGFAEKWDLTAGLEILEKNVLP
jgi:hypothetical protein